MEVKKAIKKATKLIKQQHECSDFVVLKNGQITPTAGHGACRACSCRGYIPNDGNCGNCGHHHSMHA